MELETQNETPAKKPPQRPKGKRFRVKLDAKATAELEAHATKRKLNPEQLLNKISRTVMRAKLVDAVLDDDESEQINEELEPV